MIISSRTQSIAGFITSLITHGRYAIKNLHSVIHTFNPQNQMKRNLVLLDVVNRKFHNHRRFDEYVVTLSSGEDMYILAANTMDAAYAALELSNDRHTQLVNVRLTDEW